MTETRVMNSMYTLRVYPPLKKPQPLPPQKKLVQFYFVRKFIFPRIVKFKI